MKSTEEMDFGEYIKALRIAEDRSLRQTAIAIGVTPQFFSDIENRKRSVFTPERLDSLKKYRDQDVQCSVRPEEFVIGKQGEKGVRGIVKEFTYLGLNTHYNVETEDGKLVEIIEESSIEEDLKPGEEVVLTIKKEKINVFNADGTVNLVRGDSNEE